MRQIYSHFHERQGLWLKTYKTYISFDLLLSLISFLTLFILPFLHLSTYSQEY